MIAEEIEVNRFAQTLSILEMKFVFEHPSDTTC